MSVTYRDLPPGIDPLDFLFGSARITVPESYFTSERKAQLYERALEAVDVQSLHNKSRENPHGLESLPSMLRYEPDLNGYGKKWLRLEATKEVVESALPGGTPYQLQYLPLFPFQIPDWKDAPRKTERESWGGVTRVLGPINSEALLFGKNRKTYYAHACWKPAEDYFANGEAPSLTQLDDGPYVFHLSRLKMQVVEWDDIHLIGKIAGGQWADMHSFLARLQLALQGTAMILETRYRNLERIAKYFGDMPIYYGR